MKTDELQENLPERVRTSLPERVQNVEIAGPLDAFGLAAGVFLVVVGLTTVAGMPWTYKAGIGAAGLQVLGALATAAVGAGLVWLLRTQR